MTGPQAHLLSGDRLHLSHGPIDLIVTAEGLAVAREAAFAAATARFATILEEIVTELPLLRCPPGALPRGTVARRMHRATLPHLPQFITPMAAVAGAVADTVLAAMREASDLTRAVVNNGGDIALHLASGAAFRVAVASPAGAMLGQVDLRETDSVGGIATSGLGGRSQTLGIADAVTVLARSAAGADAAATLIANAVDLPGHPAIRRVSARDLHPDSDLGDRAVTTSVGALTPGEVGVALARGAACAEAMRARGLIHAAALFLRGQTPIIGPLPFVAALPERTPAHA